MEALCKPVIRKCNLFLMSALRISKIPLCKIHLKLIHNRAINTHSE
jgi:hypothetical protein